MVEGLVFYGQLSLMDRRFIRGLNDPTGEKITPGERRGAITRVLELSKDPMVEGLILDSMPTPFYGFNVRLRETQPSLSAREAIERYLSGLLAGNMQ